MATKLRKACVQVLTSNRSHNSQTETKLDETSTV